MSKEQTKPWIKRRTDWCPMGRRKRKRPRRSWPDEVDEAIERQVLEDGNQENKKNGEFD